MTEKSSGKGIGMIRSRLSKEMDADALKLTTSMDFDWNIFQYDLLVDYAHVLMLFKTGHLNENELRSIIKALKTVEKMGFDNLPKGEDVHEAIEAAVIELTEFGKKMHTARSRNDEIATCLRLFARDKILEILSDLAELRSVLLKKASEYKDIVMPGFTHLQYAQPTKLSHHLIAYHDMVERDFQRFLDAFKRINKSPLGSAAFASTSFNIDRNITAKLLGFEGLIENSMDAVASRDFLIEFVSCCSLLMLSFSRICEEIILWSSEFGFVELPDEFASSSSIMPQKKNPDVAEIIRAKAGRVIGNLTAVMAIYKALPFTYNRDFQEMNRILFDVACDTSLSAKVMMKMLNKIAFKVENMIKKAGKGFTVATEIADLLVKKGIAFRDAHKIVGEIAKRAEKPDKNVVKEILKEFGIELSDEEIDEVTDPTKVVERKKVIGGPSKERIEEMITARIKKLEEDKEKLTELKNKAENAIKKLREEVERYGGEMG